MIPERCVGILLVEMLNHLGHDFCVGLRFKDVALLHQELLDVENYFLAAFNLKLSRG